MVLEREFWFLDQAPLPESEMAKRSGPGRRALCEASRPVAECGTGEKAVPRHIEQGRAQLRTWQLENGHLEKSGAQPVTLVVTLGLVPAA